MYGEYLHDGLGAMPGPRYAGESLRIPKPSPFTGTAQGGTINALFGFSPKIPQLLFGRTPLWEVEGQQVDQFYDVRGNTGLGQVGLAYERPMPGGSWGGSRPALAASAPAAAGASAPTAAPVAEVLGPVAGILSNPLLLVAVALGAYAFMTKGR